MSNGVFALHLLFILEKNDDGHHKFILHKLVCAE